MSYTRSLLRLPVALFVFEKYDITRRYGEKKKKWNGLSKGQCTSSCTSYIAQSSTCLIHRRYCILFSRRMAQCVLLVILNQAVFFVLNKMCFAAHRSRRTPVFVFYVHINSLHIVFELVEVINTLNFLLFESQSNQRRRTAI